MLTVDDCVKEFCNKSPEWRRAFIKLAEVFVSLEDDQKNEIISEIQRISDSKEKVSGAATPETESTH